MDITVASRGEADAFYALLHCMHTGGLLPLPQEREAAAAAGPGLEMLWDDNEDGRQCRAQHPLCERSLYALCAHACWIVLQV